MPPEPFLRWFSDPAGVPPGLRTALIDCWRDVANAGGAVGFAELLPVTADDVAPALDEIVAGLHPRLSRLLIATLDDDLAGLLLLTGNDNPVIASLGASHPAADGAAGAWRGAWVAR